MRRLTLILALILAAALNAVGQGTYTQIDYPGAPATQGFGINDAGDIVGSYSDSPAGPYHGFLLVSGAFTSIDYPGASSTTAFDINNRGQVVGDYVLGTELGAFVYDVSSQTFSSVIFPGNKATIGMATNDRGIVLGVTENRDTILGFVLNAGSFHRILPPGYVESHADGINNVGDIVGCAYVTRSSSTCDNYLYSRGVYNILQLGLPDAGVYGLNDSNVLVGSYRPSSFVVAGFTYDGSAYQILNYSLTYTAPSAINNSGQVVGTFSDSNFGEHAFVWTPLSAPARSLVRPRR
jgi:probable HAF family extracellular repeat protein